MEGNHFDRTITRAELDNMKLNLVTKVLSSANVSTNQIDHVLLVGESALMPSVRAIEVFFDHGVVEEPTSDGQRDPYVYCKGMSRMALWKIEKSSPGEGFLAIGRELDGGIIAEVLKF